MNPSIQIAKHFHDVHFGGNWTSVNLKDTLNDVTWQQATKKIQDLNTIAALVFHIDYYVAGVLKVLQGRPLDIHDKFSFDPPPIMSDEAWQDWLNKTWTDAEKLEETFVDAKYGTYYRNLHGLIEHTHYHLGQIVLIKKLIAQMPV